MAVKVKVKRQQPNRSVKQVFVAYILHIDQVDGFKSVGREGVYAYKINVSAKENQKEKCYLSVATLFPNLW